MRVGPRDMAPQKAMQRGAVRVATRVKTSFRRTSTLVHASKEGTAAVGVRAPSPVPHLMLHGLEAVALVGACVTGYLARKRREEIQVINDRLRVINEQLRNKGSIEGTIAEFGSDIEDAIEEEESRKADAQQIKTNVTALEQSLSEPSASHPVDGAEGNPQGRKEMYTCLKTGKEALVAKNPEKALQALTRAFDIAEEYGEQMAEVSALVGQARACKMLGKYTQAISILMSCLPIMEGLEEENVAIDIYGEIADVYTEIGDYQKAAEFYDYFIKEVDDL